MILHYLKVAFRNLLKYKTQSIISIVGLAVGFTCFALSTLWLRYEMTYDSFHEDAERIYQLFRQDSNISLDSKNTAFYSSLASELKLHFPEIESACAIGESYNDYGTHAMSLELQVDSSFLSMFHVRLLAGSMDFLTHAGQVALTEEAAIRRFGSESPLGKEIDLNNGNSKMTVVAVVSGWDKHSNLPFEILSMHPSQMENSRMYIALYVWIKLKKETDVSSFRKKLYAYRTMPNKWGNTTTNFEISPIEQCRYQLFPWKQVVQFHYLILFSVTGGLVILCALFNYLSLFASRLRMRVREMALRKVCGSSNRRLFVQLSMEFILVLVLACTLGMAIIELTLPIFQVFTEVTGSIYVESLIYFAGLMLLAMLAFLLVVYYFNRQTLQRTLKGMVDKQGQQFFYRSSIVLQMVIGILFIFCIVVIVKQLDYLRNSDFGMERKNIGILYPDAEDNLAVLNLESKSGVSAAVAEKLRQMPFIIEVVDGVNALFPKTYSSKIQVKEWEGKRPTDEVMWIETVSQGEAVTKFYQFRLLEGEFFSDNSDDNVSKVLINETCAKQFGWDNPIGKRIGDYTVVGMIKDFHNSSPTSRSEPVLVISASVRQRDNALKTVLIKYGNHPWKTVRDSIDSMMVREFSGVQCRKVNVEEEYEKFLQSEDVLLKLLSIVAVVCILISAFGIYSFVTLTCERRRKEIAIRKVNGAKVSHILFIFLKEYTILLLISSVIAFSVGYMLMKRWLESYVEQTSISIWVYLVVFASITLVVLFSIGSRVWLAARQNPAEVIKSE